MSETRLRSQRQGRAGCQRVRCRSSNRAMCVVNVVTTAISRVTSDNRAVSSCNGGVRTGVEAGTPICVDTGVRHRLGSPGGCSVVVVGVGVYFNSPATRRTFGTVGRSSSKHSGIASDRTGTGVEAAVIVKCGLWVSSSRLAGLPETQGTCCWLSNDTLTRHTCLTTAKCRRQVQLHGLVTGGQAASSSWAVASSSWAVSPLRLASSLRF